MKKILTCVMAAFAALVLSGCDTNEVLSCTNSTTANGLVTTTTYDIEYQDDDVKKLTITYDYKTDTSIDGVGTGTDGSAVDNDTNNNTNNNTARNGINDDTNDTNNNNNTNGNTNNGTTNNTNGNNGTNNNMTDNNDTNNYTTRNNTDGIIDTDSNDDGEMDADDIVDGVVGDAIDTTINTITGTILDIAGIRDRYNNQNNTYANIAGLTTNVEVDNDDEYRIVYEIDYDVISDADLARFNADRSLNTLRDTYESQGLTCR